MLIVHINVHVLPEHVEGFRAASIENARNSIQEPGIARFEVLQQPDDATRFVFVEVYREFGRRCRAQGNSALCEVA